MTHGRLIAVVGPSGVGKDSVMTGIAAARPDMHLVRRTITRAPGLGGEDYDPVTETAFAAMVADGAFALHWPAHGLRYGIPRDVLDRIGTGTDCLVNFSRSALAKGARVFPRFTVLNITASPEVLAERLTHRGRESAADIAARLKQAGKPLPEGLDVITLSNDGALDETVARALVRLQPERV